MALSKKRITQLLFALLRLSTALALAGAWIYFSGTISGRNYEHAVHDALIRFRGPLPPPDDIVLVALDESTYQVWGLPMDRPIPREKHGLLLKRLAELGAKQVVFDIVFAGRSANPDWDQTLAEGVASLPTVLAVDHGVREAAGMTFYDLIKPDEFLSSKAAALGLVGMQLDDNTARNFYINKDEVTKGFPTLSEAAAGYLDYKDLLAAPLPDETDLINFYGPALTIKTISMYQVLETEVPIPDTIFTGKTVFVGLVLRTGLGASQKDKFRTPFGDIFGVEIHATQAANIKHQSWIHRPSETNEKIVGGALLFIILLIMLRAKPIIGLFLGIGAITIWGLGAYYALNSNFFLCGASAVTIGVPLAVLINITSWYLLTRKRQQQIEKAFSLYLSPAMVSQLKKNPESLKLGGDETFASAIFTDIKGFTTISEQLGAVGVTKMLNEYFTDVSQAVMEEGGTVIKFIGDAVFALWGAPLAQEDHALRACRAALRIQDTVDRFNARGNFPKLGTRVGVNTGKMVVGNLGSQKRFDYTAIGDAVNLAARVEGVNKYLGSTVLITADTLDVIGEHDFHLLRMGAIRVVGKEIPVSLFRMDQKPFAAEIQKDWTDAMTLFAGRHWLKASEKFAEIAGKCEELKIVSEFYIDNIEGFKSSPPPENWMGEVSMDHK